MTAAPFSRALARLHETEVALEEARAAENEAATRVWECEREYRKALAEYDATAAVLRPRALEVVR
jgi:hypothetical protein